MSGRAKKPPSRRDKALKIAEIICGNAFRGRTGHGQGACSYRQMTREELTAYLVVAFEFGCEWEARL